MPDSVQSCKGKIGMSGVVGLGDVTGTGLGGVVGVVGVGVVGVGG